MAAPRNSVAEGGGGGRDEESNNAEDSPTSKKPIGARSEGKFPLTRWELAAALSVFFVFSTGLFYVYLTMPDAEYGKLKMPRTVSDLRALKYVFLAPVGAVNLMVFLCVNIYRFHCRTHYVVV